MSKKRMLSKYILGIYTLPKQYEHFCYKIGL